MASEFNASIGHYQMMAWTVAAAPTHIGTYTRIMSNLRRAPAASVGRSKPHPTPMLTMTMTCNATVSAPAADQALLECAARIRL